MFRSSENAFRIALRADHHVMLQMDTGFRKSCGARGVEPECCVILTGELRVELGRILLDKFGEVQGSSRRFLPNHDDVLQVAQLSFGD